MADDTQRASRRLPRGPQPAKPGPDEKVRKKSGVDLQNGWYGRHGTLYLTDERMVFVPTILDGLLRARRHEMRLDEITEVERSPADVDELPRGGRRPRLCIHTPRCVYELMVPDLDAWIDAIQMVYVLRQRAGRSYMPTVTRVGIDNLLLAEE